MSVILALFQECLDDGCTLAALKVHVAAIVAHHALIAACSIGKCYLIIRFPTDVRSSYPSFRAQDVTSDFLPHLGNNKMLICCVWFRLYTFTLSDLATFTTLFTQKLLFFSIYSPSLCCTSPNLNDDLFSVKHSMRFFCNALFRFALSHASQ